MNDTPTTGEENSKPKTDASLDDLVATVAKAFFSDCSKDPDYPHESWEEQAERLHELLRTNEISEDFLRAVANANSNPDSPSFH